MLLRKRAFLPEALEESEEAKLLLANAHGLEEDDEDTPHRVLLARAAFALMDADGDGDLSRVEMVSSEELRRPPIASDHR